MVFSFCAGFRLSLLPSFLFLITPGEGSGIRCFFIDAVILAHLLRAVLIILTLIEERRFLEPASIGSGIDYLPPELWDKLKSADNLYYKSEEVNI